MLHHDIPWIVEKAAIKVRKDHSKAPSWMLPSCAAVGSNTPRHQEAHPVSMCSSAFAESAPEGLGRAASYQVPNSCAINESLYFHTEGAFGQRLPIEAAPI